MAICLGIDPGSTRLGVGCVERQGARFNLIYAETVAPPASGEFFERLSFISVRLGQLLDDLKPQAVAIESAFFGKNAHSAFQLGTARGVAIAGCLQRGIKIFEYAPAQVKSVVTGYGRSDKDQVRKMVEATLGQSLTIGHDATDALAIAICHASSVNWGVRDC
ncbi:MAG: crossover junction endodeoxyribonuclease RuvC [Deltaproteobacteria bacterium]|nr:crossover junction endodeoxyribonuclease RuvC [Deltaproteobacteria bacterium]MBI3296185.1 crossover junction endodeoxyribonuclease RuvC [Deltaproteobacteria bacterium]